MSPGSEHVEERTLQVGERPHVVVALSRGPVTILTGRAREVHVKLRVLGRAGLDGPEALRSGKARVAITQDARTVRVDGAGGLSVLGILGWEQDLDLQFAAEVTVPPNADVTVDTTAGEVTLAGALSGTVEVSTNDAGILAEGGSGAFSLDTSGGPISVARVLGSLEADTSDGEIRVGYVGPTATEVALDTADAAISVGIDPAGKFSIWAETSEGRIEVSGLPFAPDPDEPDALDVELNGGGASIDLDTCDAPIRLSASRG